ncbi:MAG: cupin domain-containing protein [Phycisphaera sp.]|nr:cupin domain-containing protein [Phycisphaera sp.]
MAQITIPDEQLTLTDVDEVRAFLAPLGIWYERWDVEGRIDRDATNEEILDAYAPEIDRLKQRGGYVTADVIQITPDTPNLDAILAKFNREHTHSEDEVRFIVKGRGLFHINLDDAPVFAIEVNAGDLINVPAGTRHWYDMCDDMIVRAIRLFRDPVGWTPEYVDGGVHDGYEPICFGPAYIPAGATADVAAPVIDPARSADVAAGEVQA